MLSFHWVQFEQDLPFRFGKESFQSLLDLITLSLKTTFNAHYICRVWFKVCNVCSMVKWILWFFLQGFRGSTRLSPSPTHQFQVVHGSELCDWVRKFRMRTALAEDIQCKFLPRAHDGTERPAHVHMLALYSTFVTLWLMQGTWDIQTGPHDCILKNFRTLFIPVPSPPMSIIVWSTP